jgi:hypothetical protein
LVAFNPEAVREPFTHPAEPGLMKAIEGDIGATRYFTDHVVFSSL